MVTRDVATGSASKQWRITQKDGKETLYWASVCDITMAGDLVLSCNTDGPLLILAAGEWLGVEQVGARG